MRTDDATVFDFSEGKRGAVRRPQRDTRDNGYRKPREDRRGPRRPHEEDDKGTVLTCTKCHFAFFSRWEAPEGFGEPAPEHETLSEKARHILTNEVPKKHQVCERCTTGRIFQRNMAILAGGN